ncbi:hypothetical protein [Streptomyces violascens]|uniref:hypothetical protein n=1 Tax=Streptomyces violascens TaxID=67381 RepID=UPI003687F97B
MPTGYPRSTSDGANWSNSSNWAEDNAYWNNFTGDPTASYDPSTRAVAFAGPLGPPGLGGATAASLATRPRAPPRPTAGKPRA